MGEAYSVRVESHDGATTIVLDGEIDLVAGPAVRAAVADAVLRFPPKRLVIDLTGTTFMDSTGVNALVLARHVARMVGASIEVMPSPAVARILEVFGLPDFGAELAPAG